MVNTVNIRVAVIINVDLGVVFSQGFVHRAGRFWLEWVVSQVRIFQDEVGHIDAETVHSTLEPKAEHIEHDSLDLGVAPVQVRLFLEE